MMKREIDQNWNEIMSIVDRYLENRSTDHNPKNFSEVLSFVDTIDEGTAGYTTTFIIVDNSYLNQQFGKSTVVYYFQINTTENFLRTKKNEPTNKFCWLVLSNQGKPSFDRFCAMKDFGEETTHEKLLTLLTFPQENIRTAARKVLDLS